MADTKISDLAAVTGLIGTDEFVLARAGDTKKIDASDLATSLGTGMPIGTRIDRYAPSENFSSLTGTFARTYDATNALVGHWYVQNTATHAQNDEVQLEDIYLDAGDWQINCWGISSTDRAIWTIRLDSVDTVTADFYSASLTFNKLVTTSAFTVASAGLKTLKIKGATRNASATDWYLSLVRLHFRRTA